MKCLYAVPFKLYLQLFLLIFIYPALKGHFRNAGVKIVKAKVPYFIKESIFKNFDLSYLKGYLERQESKLFNTKLTVFYNGFFCKHYFPLLYRISRNVGINLLHTKNTCFMKECIFKNVCIFSLCNFITSFFLLRTFIFIYPT